MASRPASAKPAVTSIATAVRRLSLPWTATSVADTMATPSAEPHCRVAVSSALAVPSDRAANRPAGAGQGGGHLAEPGGDAERELGRQQPGQRAAKHCGGRAGQGQQQRGAAGEELPQRAEGRLGGEAGQGRPRSWRAG